MIYASLYRAWKIIHLIVFFILGRCCLKVCLVSDFELSSFDQPIVSTHKLRQTSEGKPATYWEDRARCYWSASVPSSSRFRRYLHAVERLMSWPCFSQRLINSRPDDGWLLFRTISHACSGIWWWRIAPFRHCPPPSYCENSTFHTVREDLWPDLIPRVLHRGWCLPPSLLPDYAFLELLLLSTSRWRRLPTVKAIQLSSKTKQLNR